MSDSEKEIMEEPGAVALPSDSADQKDPVVRVGPFRNLLDGRTHDGQPPASVLAVQSLRRPRPVAR